MITEEKFFVIDGPWWQERHRAWSHCLHRRRFSLSARRWNDPLIVGKLITFNILPAFARKEEEKPAKLSDIERLKKRDQ